MSVLARFAARFAAAHTAPALLAVALALPAVARQAGDPPPARPPLPDEGDEACTDCHASIVASWRATGMARALGPIRPGELAGLEPVEEEATGLRYHFEESGGRAFLVETRAPDERDERGVPHRDSARLAFAIGAGDQDRAFVAVRDGRMWFAPLEVLGGMGHGGERRAALGPGHAMSPGLRFDMPITSECLGCHTERLPPRDFPLNLLPEPDVWRPRGIGCAACHAGTAAHVDWREAELSGEPVEGADPVLSRRALGRVERMSICAACHLQGDARIELEAGWFGPPPPGGDLLARRAVFVAAEPSGEIGFVSQVERLVLSRCYTESGAYADGGLSCASCHDPHVSVYEPRERERVRRSCLECHPATHADSSRPASACSIEDAEAKRARDCVDCHMRKTPVFDVAEVEIRDHWIRTSPGPPSPRVPLRFPESPGGDWRRFRWPDAPPPAHVDDPGLWMMAAYGGGHVARAAELVDRQPGSEVAGLPMYHHVRGVLLEELGRTDDARLSYARAIGLDPQLADSMSNLGLLLGRTGAPGAGRAWLDLLLARHPRADGALRNRALVRRALGDLEGFFADLEAAMRLRPDANVARALADARARAGDAAAAAHWAEEARRLDPLRR